MELASPKPGFEGTVEWPTGPSPERSSAASIPARASLRKESNAVSGRPR
ncbi:MAG: hypothetical protein MPJ08_00275 [Nitrosopumilus sp.]|nr:hypothetical protein [Nitrosopumilus sp.]